MEVKTMEDKKTIQPSAGTWEKLPTEEIERKPKVSFDVNIPVSVTFQDNAPKEYPSEISGVYYVFDVTTEGQSKVIMTSAWTLLRALKIHMPLKGKTLKITKKLIKGKQQFVVE
jgi:hypothetical protein